MIRRIWALFKARNLEFLRDRSSVAWNILFPILVVVGFSVIFNDDSQILYKVGVISDKPGVITTSDPQLDSFRKMKYIDFIPLNSIDMAQYKLLHHRIDLLVNPFKGTYRTSETSPKGYIAERLLISSALVPSTDLKKETITGVEVPYIEWLFPGILGMNMMFSALFGVGYVVVNYRKNGVLKRMSVTPLRPWEFLTSQILSRMYLLILTTTIVFFACKIIYGFEVRGSYLTLALVFVLGGFSMISLALVVASRSGSEEFAGGILNLITWPMMFLSEVWFSLEGTSPWVQKVSRIFPLTQMIDASRQIMNDGAGIEDVRSHILILAGMSLTFLVTGSLLFKWHKQ